MERDNYKYDIALSFAEEDRNIAVALARELGRKGISVYYYPDNIIETAGKQLSQKLTEIYTKDAKYAVVIVSDHYFQKKFAEIEFEAIKNRVSESPDNVYMIPLLVGNIQLLEQHSLAQISALKWEYNPEKIAEILCNLLGADKQKTWRDDKHSEYKDLVRQNDILIRLIEEIVTRRQTKNKFFYPALSAASLILVLILTWYVLTHGKNKGEDPVDEVKKNDTPRIDTPIIESKLKFQRYDYRFQVSKDTVTDIKLHPGDTVFITARGVISPAPLANNCGPEGISAETDIAKIVSLAICPHKQWNYAALIYRLGSIDYWKLYGFEPLWDIAMRSGYLEFAINDNNQDDNSGGYDIEVTILRPVKIVEPIRFASLPITCFTAKA